MVSKHHSLKKRVESPQEAAGSVVNENKNESSLKSHEEALNSVDRQEKVAGDAPNY